MSVLRIYFSSLWRDSASSCAWALCDDHGVILQSGADTLAAMPKGHDCVGIVAPDRVLCVAAKAPPGSRRRWLTALPFMAEEYTLPDPEENHVVPGPVQADGRIMLAVVDKLWLRHIVEACRIQKLTLRQLLPETLLPGPQLVERNWNPASWVLVWNGTSGFVRTGAASGMALDNGDADTAPLVLRLCLDAAQASPPQEIEIRFSHELAEERRILPHWNLLPVVTVAGAVWDWRNAPLHGDALNLLWGDFAPRTKFREWWPHIRPAIGLLLIVLAIESIGVNLEWAMLAAQKKTLTQDMERSFRAAFGDASTLVNAPLQMQRNLSGLRHAAGLPDDADFLPLLDSAAPSLAMLPVGSVRALHYEAGHLDVDLRLSRRGDIQSLGQQMQNSGVKVQMGDIHEAADGAEARLTLLPGEGR
ncbi:MAG: type II secretion system protein GspL [Pseudomonadota bacterium]